MTAPIDRHAVIARHSPVLTSCCDHATVLAIGNGQLAYTPDVTGFQSLNASYTQFPLTTLTDWAWHTSPFPEGVDPFREFAYTYRRTSTDRSVPYATIGSNAGAVTDWLRSNPHRLDVGQVSLRAIEADGGHRPLTESELSDARQELDLWTGTLSSSFTFGGGRVDVVAAAHPDLDAIGWSVRLSAGSAGKLAVRLAFAYGSSAFGGGGADWGAPDESHATTIVGSGDGWARLSRVLDDDSYEARAHPT